MAQEITIRASLSVSKGGASSEMIVAPLALNMSGNRFIRHVQNVGFASEEAVQKGELGTLGFGLFKNLDATNFVELRLATGVTPGLKIKAGESILVRFNGGNSPFLIADTAGCLVEYLIVED